MGQGEETYATTVHIILILRIGFLSLGLSISFKHLNSLNDNYTYMHNRLMGANGRGEILSSVYKTSMGFLFHCFPVICLLVLHCLPNISINCISAIQCSIGPFCTLLLFYKAVRNPFV